MSAAGVCTEGYRHVQGSSPITINLLQVIQHTLVLTSQDRVSSGFFGFYTQASSSLILCLTPVSTWLLVTCRLTRWWILHASVFTSSPLRLTAFSVGCVIYLGREEKVLCPVIALGSFLAILCYAVGHLFTKQRLSCLVQSILHSAGYHGSYSGPAD